MRDIMLEGDYAFRVMENGEAEFCWFRSQYEGTGTDIPETVEIPDRVGEHPVTGIQPLGFVEFEAIRRISLPDTVVFSEGTPFESCPNLEEIVVSPGHPSLTVENGLLIDRAAKRVLCCPAGSRMETVQVPEWVTSVGNNAFANCTQIRSVVLPEGILEIGQGAFFGCVRLGRISVPSGVREIGNYTFMDCAGLKEISLPEGIRRIGDFAFAFCTSLTSLRLPDSVESFGCFSFSDCENLREVNLPLQLKEIDLPPFIRCSRLAAVTIPDGQETYRMEGSLLINREQREVVCCFPALVRKGTAIPESVRRIGDFAFGSISSLRNIVVPEGVEIIGSQAFTGCEGLRSVHLPDSLTTLEDFAFLGCRRLRNINLPRSIQSFGSLCLYRESYLQAAVKRNSAARDFCRDHRIPYRIAK